MASIISFTFREAVEDVEYKGLIKTQPLVTMDMDGLLMKEFNWDELKIDLTFHNQNNIVIENSLSKIIVIEN